MEEVNFYVFNDIFSNNILIWNGKRNQENELNFRILISKPIVSLVAWVFLAYHGHLNCYEVNM